MLCGRVGHPKWTHDCRVYDANSARYATEPERRSLNDLLADLLEETEPVGTMLYVPADAAVRLIKEAYDA